MEVEFQLAVRFHSAARVVRLRFVKSRKEHAHARAAAFARGAADHLDALGRNAVRLARRIKSDASPITLALWVKYE